MNLEKQSRGGDFSVWPFVVLILSLLLPPSGAQAAPQLDQSFDALQVAAQSKWELTGAGIGLGIASAAAQTFTVGSAGVLTGIEVQIFKGTNATKRLELEIRKTGDALPAEEPADILLRKEISLDKIPAARPVFVPVELREFCLQVKEGDVLAIVLLSGEEESGYGWQTAVGNRYGGGGRYARSRQTPAWDSNVAGLVEHDLGFKTFVDPDAVCQAKSKITN